MKKRFIIGLLIGLLPIVLWSQSIDKTIKLKVAVMQNFVKNGDQGETLFWQTKGKITFGIVHYTDEQNPIFRDLFIKQYKELLAIYKKMIVSEDEKDTNLYIKTLIRQEEDYRKLLSTQQLQLYFDKFEDLEKNNPTAFDSFSSLFFSKKLLELYKTSFE
ncbi:hypothetical protein FLBR109950_12335 [Flavobacterium branchiophilum]|uniref:Uncharacterized protein n=1 Tax=Flavobacterium branchiophilum (strain FL-15) TaxID=1034807 RepID=G2Z779_FLABF|nr:hypothetical protein [Flavobacterium branchiophilum]CCB69254.1 Hypothetical protein precursor [Flavobacterium branchiophilum FL-15]